MVEKTVGWRATKLWEYVEKSTEEGHPVRRTLGEAMPAIETVLAKGGTASQAFTLHDADHGLRVARRMAELMPRPVGETVNVVEAALLLLAAFLHDIGMTPPGKITSKIHSYLLTGDRSLLTSRERADLQKWLDTKKGGLTPPIE
ncbi:MAG: HD domain-containing protein, partial [Archangium sp.]